MGRLRTVCDPRTSANGSEPRQYPPAPFFLGQADDLGRTMALYGRDLAARCLDDVPMQLNQLVRAARTMRTCPRRQSPHAREAEVYRDASPADYRMLQVADYVCCVELAAAKYDSGGEGATDRMVFGNSGRVCHSFAFTTVWDLLIVSLVLLS